MQKKIKNRRKLSPQEKLKTAAEKIIENQKRIRQMLETEIDKSSKTSA